MNGDEWKISSCAEQGMLDSPPELKKLLGSLGSLSSDESINRAKGNVKKREGEEQISAWTWTNHSLAVK